ncbi:MAG: TPM domain-containing protein [Candidatus Desantisbacteria bacterium]
MRKRFLLCLFLLMISKCYAGEITYPEPIGFVNDFAGVIPENDEAALNQLLNEVKEKGNGAEIAVVTAQSIAPMSIEEYSVRLFEKWGIGKKGKDNGVLVLLAINEKKARIEVGYGLEGALPDGKCGEIIRMQMAPYFKNGDFGTGILSGVSVITQVIAKEYGIQLEGSRQDERRVVKTRHGLFEQIFFLLFILIGGICSFVSSIFPGSRSRRGFWSGGSGLGMGLGMSGFGGGGGGFSGGFGGFGGGFSGGGGASGGW